MHYSAILPKLWSALILVGVILLSGCPSVPVVTPGAPVSQIPTPEIDTATYHTIQRGETLYAIAQRYGRDYKAIAHWNNIMPPYALNVGQRLRIDGPSSDSMTTPSMPQYPDTPVISPPPPISTMPPSPEPPSEKGVHTVQAGETLYAIARNYGQNVSDVAAWNNIEPPYNLSIGQRLIVSDSESMDEPTSVPIQPTSPPVGGDRDYHTVLKGDTLYSIAKHYGYSVTDIAAWSGLQQPYILSLGQELRVSPPGVDTVLPTPRPSTPSYEPSSPSYPSSPSDDEIDSSDYHIVAAKETLYSISRQYGYSVQEIAKWNNLATPYNLSIGQKLRVTPPSTMMLDATPDSRYFQRVKLPPPSRDNHVVKPGETLTSIAKQYGISYLDLANWNGIGNPFTVYPGQNLTLIPQ
ncbi:LysM peptidoglycan-binding domain-containing protein [Candidatus Parabeggiatoa sp. HSG14]|uniref:muramidase family protein n=1 Tax=Candidatus Parabeggiatoa sp. HSG14 TaxID=3055593 RepID=UPI0025A930AF|nr:LysM peptidoglycan-binding domain-containing protein [Thiotrichales bacterium HSG14]